MSELRGPTDKPADAATATPRAATAPVSPAAPEPAVLGSGRLRVTQRDLEMYSALVGVPQALLIPEEPEAQADESGSVTARAWHSVTQSVTQSFGGLTIRLGRPELSSWVRRLSGHARRQIGQARRRLTNRR